MPLDTTPANLTTLATDDDDDRDRRRGYRLYIFISETAERPVILELPESQLANALRPSARIDGLRLMFVSQDEGENSQAGQLKFATFMPADYRRTLFRALKALFDL